MAKKKSKPVEKIRLSGRNIYTDKKGRVIFYDMITKKGYLVDKKHENSALFFKKQSRVFMFFIYEIPFFGNHIVKNNPSFFICINISS